MDTVQHIDELAMRLERTADWNGHLRSYERADLREAALRLRDLAAEVEPDTASQLHELLIDGARSTAASNTAATSLA